MPTREVWEGRWMLTRAVRRPVDAYQSCKKASGCLLEGCEKASGCLLELWEGRWMPTRGLWEGQWMPTRGLWEGRWMPTREVWEGQWMPTRCLLFQNNSIPPSWLEGGIIYKGKGTKWKCSNERGMTLSSKQHGKITGKNHKWENQQINNNIQSPGRGRKRGKHCRSHSNGRQRGANTVDHTLTGDKEG